MTTPNSIKSIAALAENYNVRVIGPHGAYELNAQGSEKPIKSDAELDRMRQATEQRLAEMNSSITNVLAASSHMMAIIKSLDDHFKLAVELHENAAKMTADLDDRIKEFNDAIQRPVVPVYNREGKLIAAKRVKK